MNSTGPTGNNPQSPLVAAFFLSVLLVCVVPGDDPLFFHTEETPFLQIILELTLLNNQSLQWCSS